MVASNHLWLRNIWTVAGMTKEMNFNFYFIAIHLHINFSSQCGFYIEQYNIRVT